MNNGNIKRDFYTMAVVDDLSAEITMYGDIVERVPTDWWGDPIPGDYIIQREFLNDLEKVKACQNITIRMHSLGGDAGVSILIHNRLRELAREGKNLTCIVDGSAMSGGSLIMCACDTVKVNPSSLIMIHKCLQRMIGYYNADELRQEASANDAYDKSQISIYAEKSGLSDVVISHMMSDTTYMTGTEAVEKGFADEVLENAEPLGIVASANRKSITVRGRNIPLAYGCKAPEYIPTVKAAEEADDNTNTNPVEGNDEGGTIMAKTVEELREEYPELTAQMEADIRKEIEASNADAVKTAVQAEQDRIKEIDEVGTLFDAELVLEAKYGEKACSAKDLAFRAAQEAKKNGTTFMKNLEADNSASGAQDVGTAPGEAVEGKDMTPEQKKAAAKALLGKKKEA